MYIWWEYWGGIRYLKRVVWYSHDKRLQVVKCRWSVRLGVWACTYHSASVSLFQCSAVKMFDFVFLQRLKDEIFLHFVTNVAICREVSKKKKNETSCNLIANLATVSIDFPLIQKLSILTSFVFLFPPVNVVCSGRDRAVGIATRYGLDGPGIESRYGVWLSLPVRTGPVARPAPIELVPGLSWAKAAGAWLWSTTFIQRRG